VLFSFGTVLNFDAIINQLDFTYSDKRQIHVIEEEIDTLRQVSLTPSQYDSEFYAKSHQITQSQTVSSGKWRPPVLSQPYPGTADLCPGGPVLSPQLVGFNMENLTNNKDKQTAPNKSPKLLKSQKS